MNSETSRTLIAFSLLAISDWSASARGATIFVTNGQRHADVKAEVDTFRARLGTLNSGPSTGSGPDGRREVNWDDIPDHLSSGGASPFPGDFYQSARGINFSASGTLEVSADSDSNNDGTPGPVSALFANHRGENAQRFAAFSPERIFGLIGTNKLDVTFSVPGQGDAKALVRGLGLVFTDIGVFDPAKLEFFDAKDMLLMTLSAPPFLGGPNGNFKSYSFAGVTFEDAVVARVRVTSGSLDLDWTTIEPGGDVVAMDDFIYGEPVAVPEPATAVLLFGGVGIVLISRTWRRLLHSQFLAAAIKRR